MKKNLFLLALALTTGVMGLSAQSQKVVIYKGLAYSYEGDSGNYYEVSWLSGYEADPVPKSGSTLAVYSADNGQGWCYVRDGVNFRKGPGQNNPVVGKSKRYTEGGADAAYPCLGKTNGWYKIKMANGAAAYVRQDLVWSWEASGAIGKNRRAFRPSGN